MHKTQTYCSKNLKSNNCVIKTSAKKKKKKKQRMSPALQKHRLNSSLITIPFPAQR